jgi:hypothetical protein
LLAWDQPRRRKLTRVDKSRVTAMGYRRVDYGRTIARQLTISVIGSVLKHPAEH